MQSKKVSKHRVPRSVKDMSPEQLKEILIKKRECNIKALRIVEALCEPVVDAKWMIDHLAYINQSHYEDVAVERSITELCGYPLCSIRLKDVPKQQFKISLQQKQVYDISERKMFCSNVCFKSSNHLKAQLLTSPLWFRDSEIIPNFTLFSVDQLKSRKCDEADILLNKDHFEFEENEQNPFDINSPSVSEDHSESNAQDDGLNDICFENKNSNSKLTKINNTADEVCSRLQDTDVSYIETIEQTMKEWFTINSMAYILGEEKVKSLLQDNDFLVNHIIELKESLNPQNKKFDDLIKLCSLLNLDEEIEERELKPLPDYSALKADTETLKIKVRAYFSGSLQQSGQIAQSNDSDSTHTEDSELRDLPLVDSHAQNALRRRLLCDRLVRVIPDICTSMDIPNVVTTADINGLVRTFHLSAHNITFKPREWFLIALIVIRLLSLKLPELHLTTESAKQRVTLLLMSYNLPQTYLDNLIEWLTDIERIVQLLKD